MHAITREEQVFIFGKVERLFRSMLVYNCHAKYIQACEAIFGREKVQFITLLHEPQLWVHFSGSGTLMQKSV